eukprot:scaffold1391_cov123-Cylindrotheca_fusiformis.AAC.9
MGAPVLPAVLDTVSWVLDTFLATSTPSAFSFSDGNPPSLPAVLDAVLHVSCLCDPVNASVKVNSTSLLGLPAVLDTLSCLCDHANVSVDVIPTSLLCLMGTPGLRLHTVSGV